MKIKEWIKANVALTVVIAIVAIYGMKLGIDFSSAPAFCKLVCHGSMAQDVDSYRASFHGGSGGKGKVASHGGHKADCHGCHYIPGLVGLIKGKINAAIVSIPHELMGKRGESKAHLPEEEWKELEEIPQYIHTYGKNGPWAAPAEPPSRIAIEAACRRCHADKTKMVNTNALLDAQKDVSLEASALAPVKKGEVKVAEGAKEFSAVPGPHASHEDKGVRCILCHAEIVHAPVALGIGPLNLPRMEICFQCHNNEKAFRDDCGKCHTGQVQMHAGVGAKGIENMPGLMNGQASCGDCGHSEGNKFKADVSTCDGCHSAGYKDMVKDWQSSYEASLAPVKSLVDEVEAIIHKGKKGHGSEEPSEAEKLFEEGKYNYDFAVEDGSRGAHNSDYTDAMLKKAKELLEQSKGLLTTGGEHAKKSH